MAHAIQLAIIDVLYSKNNLLVYQADVPKEAAYVYSDTKKDGFFNFIEPAPLDFSPELEKIIERVRPIVVIIRRSPLKNETLQKYFKLEFGKDYQLICDCKTRWNSLSAMLERFFIAKNCIKKTMIDLELEMNLEEKEIQIISQLVDSFQRIEATVHAVCRRESNLVQTDAVFSVLLDELKEQNTVVSNLLAESLIMRIKERRTKLTDALCYLQYL